MNQISKVTAALTSLTQETTLALANFSFDFALIKVQPQPQYEGLVSDLTRSRVEKAESGSLHIALRRLQSLFQSIIPETPQLVAAYGTRTSAISANLKRDSPPELELLNEYSGVDSTSIWAAATSGPGAIAIHLLACMLARVWSSDEATSIWRELVSKRKEELQAKKDANSINAENLFLSQLEVEDHHLSEFDASARAWLRSADRAAIVSAKQTRALDLMSGINGLPVNSHVEVYKSVTTAWITALRIVDHLVGGASFKVQSKSSTGEIHVEDGAVLVALCSWHLYPDINLLGSGQPMLVQGDVLIKPGGVVTVAARRQSSSSEPGVCWSLALAHLNYYGSPVMKSRSVSSDSVRFTIEQFHIVALGSLLANWKTEPSNMLNAMEFVNWIYTKLQLTTKVEEDGDFEWSVCTLKRSWVETLHKAVKSYQSARNEEGKTCRKLLNAGLRYPQLMLGHQRESAPAFGLLSLDVYKVLERQVDFFADVVLRSGTPIENWVIRVGNLYTTATKEFVWSANKDRLAESGSQQTPADLSGKTIVPCGVAVLSDDALIWEGPPAFFWSSQSASDETNTGKVQTSQKKKMTHLFRTKKAADITINFTLFAGSNDTVSLFTTNRSYEQSVIAGPITFASLVQVYFPQYGLSGHRLYTYLCQHLAYDDERKQQPLYKSLRALASCSEVYSTLPGATISPKLLSPENGSLGQSAFALDYTNSPCKGNHGLLGMRLNHSKMISCLVRLETGGLNVGSHHLGNVIAVAIEDSIYVSASLLRDPNARDNEPLGYTPLRRVFGNIGRAGVALLIPVLHPKVRKVAPEQWALLNHEEFDGKLEDNFRDTSLHIEFTGFERPAEVNAYGGRFVEAFFIETRVCVYDKDQWVADIDVPMSHDYAPDPLPGVGTKEDCPGPIAGMKPEFRVISIDCWEELLEAPEEPAVVRAHGNWQARLATSAVCSALGYSVILFSHHGCWKCGEKLMRDEQAYRKEHPQQKVRLEHHTNWRKKIFIL